MNYHCNSELIDNLDGTFTCTDFAQTTLVLDPVDLASAFSAGFMVFTIPFVTGYFIIVVVNFVRGINTGI